MVSGCNNAVKTTDDTCSYDNVRSSIPKGVKIEIDSSGRRRWKHGDHYHYLDGVNPFANDLKLEEALTVSIYCDHYKIPIQCVTEQLNVDEDMLDMEAGKLAHILGFEVFDIEQILELCKQ